MPSAILIFFSNLNLPTYALQVIRLCVWLTLLAVIFTPLERLFSVHSQKFFRQAVWTDLSYYFINSLVPGFLLGVPLGALAWAVHRAVPAEFIAGVAAWPVWARVLAAMVVGETGFYWGHRWSHEIPFLWRFHSIHHSAEQMDWLVSTRAHPVDMVFTRLCGLIPLYVLGLAAPLRGNATLVPLLVLLTGSTWGFFVHANLRGRFGPLEWLIAGPAFHHWHHANDGAAYRNKNYSPMLPWMDAIFGTLHLPKAAMPAKYGIDEVLPAHIGGQLLHPFIAEPLASHVIPAPVPEKVSQAMVSQTVVRQLLPAALLALFAVFLVLCYYPMLSATFHLLASSDDMAYGIFAPVVALYIVWEARERILHPLGAASAWGLVFLSAAAALAALATLANSSTFSRVAFLLSLVGGLLLLGGWSTLRLFVFPLSLLLFTFPVPDVLYGEITQPLQLLASRLSEAALELLGYSVLREGNILRLIHMQLSVVEACSGLRSLITLLLFCLVYGYFFETRLWVRAALVFFAVPSAIAVNAARITLTGVLGKYNMLWTTGIYHEVLGWAAFSAGIILVVAIHHSMPRFAGPVQMRTLSEPGRLRELAQ